jgi:hypothetical protein
VLFSVDCKSYVAYAQLSFKKLTIIIRLASVGGLLDSLGLGLLLGLLGL